MPPRLGLIVFFLCVAGAMWFLMAGDHAQRPRPLALWSADEVDPSPKELHAALALEGERAAAMVTHSNIRRMDAVRAAQEWTAAGEGLEFKGRIREAAEARERARPAETLGGRR